MMAEIPSLETFASKEEIETRSPSLRFEVSNPVAHSRHR